VLFTCKLRRYATGNPKKVLPEPTADFAALKSAVVEVAGPKLLALYKEEIQSKSGRGKAMAELKKAAGETLAERGLVFNANQLDGAYLHACSKIMRDLIFAEGVRVDGRKTRQLRELAAEVKVMPVVHGSSLFERGNTQVGDVGSCAATFTKELQLTQKSNSKIKRRN
jgi:polyribonucleotide nucleotidyltransferase